VFGAGEYSPDTLAGRKLLAHELIHVVQQRERTAGLVQRKGSPIPTSKKTKKKKKFGIKDCYVFIYDTGDKALSPIWKASAESFAQAHDGLTVASGSSASATLGNIISTFNKHRAKYRCIKAIEFFGHGVAGKTLVGKGELTDKDIPPAASKAGKLTGSHSSAHLTLYRNFRQLRSALCGKSYLHFRSCETFKGTKGVSFATKLSKYLGKSYLIGHTNIIDVNLPGREVYSPKGKKLGKGATIPTTLIPTKKPASKLKYRHFIIKLDFSGLGKKQKSGKGIKLPGALKFFLTSRKVIYVSMQVLDHSDKELYLVRLLFTPPQLVALSSLTAAIVNFVPAAQRTGPTLKFLKAKGDAIDLPIDRRIIERIAMIGQFSFPFQSQYGPIRVSIKGRGKRPSVLARTGGIEHQVGLVFSQTDPKLLGEVNLQFMITRLGLFSIRGVKVDAFKLYGGLGLLYGLKTSVGRANLGLQLDLETLNLDVGVFGGGGLYQGKSDWLVGGNLGMGAKFGNFTVSTGWQFYWIGQGGKEPNHSGFLRLGWRFDKP